MHNACKNIELEKIDEVAITESQYNSILHMQSYILDMLARGEEPKILLDKLCNLAESLLPNSVASIMLLDKESGLLNILAAPSVPEIGHKALANLRPGPGGGSCGNAIFSNEPTFVGDTFVDPKWKDIRKVAYDFNLRACWSMPVRNNDNSPMATFALSSFENRLPSSFHKKLLEIGANIVQIVLKNDYQKKQIEEKEKKINLLSVAVQNTSEGFYITDKDTNIIEVNEAFAQMMGYTKEEILGKTPQTFASGKHDKKYFEAMWQEILQNHHFSGEIVNKKKNGELITQWISINPILDEQKNIANYVALFTDISKLKQSEDRIEYLAYHDVLTSCFNKLSLEDKMTQSTETEDNFLILLNVDNFSYVNLSYGFDIGDKLLVGIANELRELCERTDIYRINSDEFALLCPNSIEVKKKIEGCERPMYNKRSLPATDAHRSGGKPTARHRRAR